MQVRAYFIDQMDGFGVGGRCSPPPETCGGAWQYMSDERRIRSLFEAGALIVEALDADQDDEAFRAEVTGIAEWSRCCLFDRRACNARLRAHFDDPAGVLVDAQNVMALLHERLGEGASETAQTDHEDLGPLEAP